MKFHFFARFLCLREFAYFYVKLHLAPCVLFFFFWLDFVITGSWVRNLNGMRSKITKFAFQEPYLRTEKLEEDLSILC